MFALYTFTKWICSSSSSSSCSSVGCLMAEVRVEARGQGINVTGVIMEWWHKVGIHDWHTGPWISGFWFIFGLRAPSPSIYTLYLKTMNVVNLETENSYKITWCWNICNSPNKLSALWCHTHKTSSWPDLPCCCGPPGRWWTMFWMSTLCSSNIQGWLFFTLKINLPHCANRK